MSSGYSLYEMTSFPEVAVGESVEVSYQLPLIEDIDKPPVTTFKLQRRMEDLGVEVFRVYYEYIDKRVGRTHGITFTAFVAMVNFPAYYFRQRQLFMVKAGKPLARGAMRQLIKTSPNVNGKFRKIEIDTIRHLIDSFKGVYFSVEDSADVSTVALFGPSVDQDIRFARAATEGAMNYARFDYVFEGEIFHVGISSESNVVLYDNNLDEVLELELLLDIKANLLDHAKERV